MIKKKRRFSRIPFRVRAEMIVGGIKYNAEEITNLSVGGCLLPIHADLKTGSACRIKVLLSETGSEISVKVSGNVVRCSTKAVAVQFTHIDPISFFHLQNIMRYNSPNPGQFEMEKLNRSQCV